VRKDILIMAQILDEIINDIEDTQQGKFLTFALGSEVYGLEIKYVKEIIGIQPIAEVPDVSKYVKGIINLRGKIIPVIDVRIKFGKEQMEYNDRTCIIVIELDDISIGLIVDSVAEVLNIPDGDIVPPPDYKTGFHNNYIKGIGKVGHNIKLLLECSKLISEEEAVTIENLT
jgi:purine-binding chemotaxis protein CheW